MSKQSKMTGADYLLLLLYLDNCSAINGAIRITKMMFLFATNILSIIVMDFYNPILPILLNTQPKTTIYYFSKFTVPQTGFVV